MTFPSIGPNWFGPVQVVLDQGVQIILDRTMNFHYRILQLEPCPKRFGSAQKNFISPNEFRLVQNSFEPIEGQG